MLRSCLPVLLAGALLGGCAAVHLGSGHDPAGADRGLRQAEADAACSRRIWRELGSPAGIQVECRGEAIWLRGYVSSEASRRALVTYVRDMAGVEKVIDRLAVR